MNAIEPGALEATEPVLRKRPIARGRREMHRRRRARQNLLEPFEPLHERRVAQVLIAQARAGLIEPRIPVHLSAFGPRGKALPVEIADGWMSFVGRLSRGLREARQMVGSRSRSWGPSLAAETSSGRIRSRS